MEKAKREAGQHFYRCKPIIKATLPTVLLGGLGQHFMKDIERQQLRQHLRNEVDTWRRIEPSPYVDNGQWLDEDAGQNYVSQEEMLVFKLDEESIIPLIVAFKAYECLIDIVFPPNFSGELLELIIKSRDICPLAKWYEFEKPFSTGIDEKQWFAWFAKEFLYIPNRQSCAFHDKRGYNLANVTTYSDEI